MSRTYDDPSAEPMAAGLDGNLEDAGRLLREPVRPMPDFLRSRLLAIPADAPSESEAEEIDRLYRAALPQEEPADKALHAESLGTTPLRAAVVRLLAAVFRHARTVRPLPERLASNLRDVRRSARPAWKTRWITEPRWAAAACWLLAFVLTLGTGDAVAGLLDAPSKLHARSAGWVTSWAEGWAQRAGQVATDAATETWAETEDALAVGVGFVRARGVAAAAWTEARAERALHDVETSWTYLAEAFAPQISAPHTTETNPGDTSPEEARDDR